MDIPFYNDIYHFPGGYLHHHCHHQHHDELKPANDVNTAKSTDVIDKFGNTRYIVQLSSMLSNDVRMYQTTVTQVVNNLSSQSLSTFLVIPEEGYEPDYAKAHYDFNCAVQRYTSLVAAEMKDFHDIDIYKENIGYEVIVPSCCMTCKWSVAQDAPREPWKHHCHGHKKLECHCIENQQAFNYAKDFPLFPNKDAHRYDKGWQTLPWRPNAKCKCPMPPEMLPIFPTVDPFGKCENYAPKSKDGNRPLP